MKLTKGRMNRSTYLLVVLATTLGALVLRFPRVDHLITTNDMAALLIIFLVAIPLILWQIVTSVRRLHDINLSGWLWVLLILPGMQLFLLLMPGKKGSNRYGPAPTVQLDVSALLTDKNIVSSEEL